MYRLIRPILFKLDAELSHELTIKALCFASKHKSICRLIKKVNQAIQSPTTEKIMGLNFPNKIGLAAGLDKHAQCINAFSAMGFGFIEIGTVTPKSQPGNEKPRLFRLPEYDAIINRMGFNSVGLDQFKENLSQHQSSSIIGINLGKNALTPLENAADDYLIGMEKTHSLADYLTINLSSPNTKQLRELQRGENFEQLIIALKRKQHELANLSGKYTPLAIKIAPDLDGVEIQDIATTCLNHSIDCIIATNTTVNRDFVNNHPLANEVGGLSGTPVKNPSTEVIKKLHHHLQGKIPIIGVGGISSAHDALEKIDAGANLIQLYTGLIYQGPQLIKQINQHFAKQ